MNKSSTPKEIIKKRIRQSKLLRLPPPAIEPKESNISININNKKYERHNREIKDDGFPNPFRVSTRMRVFTKQLPPRKVQPLPELTEDVRTVCDIHKDFYNVVEGRPLRIFDDIKVYMSNIRDLVDCRTNIGFMKDEMERIDHAYREEMEQLEKIDALCDICRSNYVQFLKQSFILALKKQAQAAEVAVKLEKMSDQLEELSFEYVRLRNGFAVVMGKYEKLSKYKTFLTSLTPAWWQIRFDVQSEHRIARICAKLNSDLDKISQSSADRSDTSLTYLKPQLYFKEPCEIMQIFDTMGRQGQNYLEIVNKTSGVLSIVRKLKHDFETAVKESCSEMHEDVENYSSVITFQKEREADCKTVFYEILLNDFKQLYSEYDIIKLNTCVKYVYDRIFGESDVIEQTITMMRHLENMYMKLSMKLDLLDTTIVNEATKQLFDQDIKMMTNAHKAHRQLQMSDILQKALYTSFEPTRNKTIKSRK